MTKCKNCGENVMDFSKSCLNERGVFCSKACYVEYKSKNPRIPEKKGISLLF